MGRAPSGMSVRHVGTLGTRRSGGKYRIRNFGGRDDGVPGNISGKGGPNFDSQGEKVVTFVRPGEGFGVADRKTGRKGLPLHVVIHRIASCRIDSKDGKAGSLNIERI